MKIDKFNETLESSEKELKTKIYALIDWYVEVENYFEHIQISDTSRKKAAEEIVNYLLATFPSLRIELDAKKYNL
jgi:hypothetical protein